MRFTECAGGPVIWSLGQRFLAGVFGKAAGVLQAGLLVVTGDGFEGRLRNRFFDHILSSDLDVAVSAGD